jgi:hypothetical protein
VLRIYLDQNHWIYLSRALNGNPRSSAEADAALFIQASIDAGQASYPLSVAHVEETWRQRRAAKRLALADTMTTISRNHTIAPPWAVVPAEIDRALLTRFGEPQDVRPLQPFGIGMHHMSGGLLPKPDAAIVTALVSKHPHLGRRQITDMIDAILLSGPAADLPIGGLRPPSRAPAEAFARAEQLVLSTLAAHESDSDERRRVVAGRMFMDLRDAIHEAQLRTSISTDEILALGGDGITEFMMDLPSRVGLLELMTRQHRNPQTVWHANDRNDLVYTSLAVGYCDIVVIERRWAANLNHSDVPARMGTTILRRLQDLPKAVLGLG